MTRDNGGPFVYKGEWRVVLPDKTWHKFATYEEALRFQAIRDQTSDAVDLIQKHFPGTRVKKTRLKIV